MNGQKPTLQLVDQHIKRTDFVANAQVNSESLTFMYHIPIASYDLALLSTGVGAGTTAGL